MTLLQYFKLKDYCLPKADSLLSEQMPKSSLLAMHKEVKNVIDSIKDCRRSPYIKYLPKVKASIAKYATAHGVVSAVRHYTRVPCLEKSTVRTWRNLYTTKLKKSVRLEDNDDSEFTELLPVKRGHSLLLGEEIDNQAKAYLVHLRSMGSSNCHGVYRMYHCREQSISLQWRAHSTYQILGTKLNFIVKNRL